MKNEVSIGVLLSIISVVSLTIMNVFVKLIGSGIPIYELIWCRFAVGLILLLPIIIYAPSTSLKLAHPFQFFLRTISGLLGLALIFMSIQKMPLTQALLLSNTTPLVVPILAFVMTRSRITLLGILGIVIGFIGVSVVLNPEHTAIGWGAVLALSSVFFVSLTILQIRSLGKTMSTWPMLFYYFLMSTVISTPFGLVKVVLPHSNHVLLLLLCMGVAGFIYQLSSTLSYKFASVRFVTPILYLNVLVGGIFEWLLWGQKPSLSFLVGCVIIIAGVMITLFFGSSANQKQIRGNYHVQNSINRS